MVSVSRRHVWENIHINPSFYQVSLEANIKCQIDDRHRTHRQLLALLTTTFLQRREQRGAGQHEAGRLGLQPRGERQREADQDQPGDTRTPLIGHL